MSTQPSPERPVVAVTGQVCGRCGEPFERHGIFHDEPTAEQLAQVEEAIFDPPWPGLYCPPSYGADHLWPMSDARPEPGACDDPTCPVLHDDPANPIHPPCLACGGMGCEEGCGRCEMAYAGPNSHRICRACNGSGEACIASS